MGKQQLDCSKPDCTFALTGTCLESIEDPPQNCPHLLAKYETSAEDAKNRELGVEDAANQGARQFHSGLELGLNDAARIMRSRYTRLIGVFGQAEVGKTCLFTSIYLQLAGRYLAPSYHFAASETLIGFEQRARHLRDWSNSSVPEQIVDRTRLGNPRSPAFLHIAFRDENAGRHDLLLPDLPGEWTSSLLSDGTKATRFQFLRRSDVVLLVLEAPAFENARSRNNAITDARHLLVRLEENVKLPRTTPLVLAVTKCDQTDGEVPSEIDVVTKVAHEKGYASTVVPLAAFPSEESNLPHGFGVKELLEALAVPHGSASKRCVNRPRSTARSYLNAGGS